MPSTSRTTFSDSASFPAIMGGRAAFPLGAPRWPPQVQKSIRLAVQELLETGNWGQYHGPYCDQLIRNLKTFLDVEHVRLCSSGTAAMELSLRGIGVKPEDEVVLAAYDFKANMSTVLALKAKPVLVDLREDDWQFDAQQLESACTDKTKAIIVSHLHGGLVDMPSVMKLARSRNISVVEDACQSPGAIVNAKQAGTWGDVGIWSFGGSKLLTAGRGGAVFTQHSQIAQRIRLWVERGNDLSPLSEMQAAVIIPQLSQLKKNNQIRFQRAEQLQSSLFDRLAETQELKPFAHSLDKSTPTYYKLAFQFQKEAWEGLTRDQFSHAIRAEGVAIFPGFDALHLTHAKSRFRAVGELSEATKAHESTLTLHHPVLLESEETIEKVIEAILKIVNHKKELVAHFDK